jgi:hypothetical protein
MQYTRDSLLSIIQSGLQQKFLSIAGLEKQAGVPKDTVRDFLRAKTHILRADKLQKILGVLAPEEKLTIRYQLAENAQVLPLEDSALPHVDYPPGISPVGVEAIHVSSDAMMPVFQPDWVLYYSTAKQASAPINLSCNVPYDADGSSPYAALLGKPCVIKLADGRWMVRALKKGSKPDHYTLAAYNAPDINDVAIENAYKILFIQT